MFHRLLHADAPVGSTVANHFSLGIPCSISRTYEHLGTTVAIKVIDDERHIVCTAPDVRSHVDTPEERTIHPVTVEERIARKPIMCIVVCIGGVPFQEDLIFPVAVHITHTGIVGRIRECPPIRCGAVCRAL